MRKIELAQLPTALHPLENLSKLLGGPRIWIKRDDNTGLALGGNKARKLEYLLADALHQQADTLITAGAFQSNHARMTAAAASKAGLKCHLVLRGKCYQRQGNLLLDELFGATIHRLEPTTDREKYMVELASQLSKEGSHPYIIDVGGSNHVGSLGYVAAVREIRDQLPTADYFDETVVAVGSGGTYAGLAIGLKQYGVTTNLRGIAVDKENFTDKVLAISNQATKAYGLPLLDEEDVTLNYQYIGEGYGIPTAGSFEAIKLLATQEGILLDPVYSGKAMAGLIDQIRSGVCHPSQNILFWHTGGAPSLFAWENQL